MKLLLFVFFPIISFGQIVYTGEIISKSSKSKIPFATIGFTKNNSGTNADEQGKFSLLSSKFENDTLIVSCVGYRTLKIPTSKFPENMYFELEDKGGTLNEIIIGKQYKKSSNLLNDFSNCGINYYTSSGFIAEVAQYFRTEEKNSLLSEVNICKSGDNALFRIRIYSMDSIKKIPLQDLIDTIIEVKSTKRHVHLDLEKYKIVIPDKDFFVSIVWLKIVSNERKAKRMMGGKKTTYSEYTPFVSFKVPQNNTLNSENLITTWQKDYKGRWIKFYPENANLLISVKVKY
jgi:hypothetical protein